MGDIYGLRLLSSERVRRLGLGVFLGIVLTYRLLQFLGFARQPQWGYDFSFYWTAAGHLLHGLPIYSAAQLSGPYVPQGQVGFLYPPPFAAALTPLAAVLPSDPHLVNWLWFGFGLVLVVASVLAIARAERLDERFALLRGRGIWWLVAGALALPPVVAELALGNVHMEILGLLSLAWLGIRRGSPRGEVVAGAAIGAAGLIKVFPGLLVLWLLATRRFRAAAASVAAMLVLTLLTLPITGIQPWRDYPTVLFNLGAPAEAADALGPTVWLVPLLGYGVGRTAVAAVGVAVVVVLGLRAEGAGGSIVAASFGAAAATSVLVAPAVYESYLTILILPMLLALSTGIQLRWLGPAYLLMWGGQQPALGDLAWVIRRGMPALGAGLLLVLLADVALRVRATGPVSRSGDDVPLGHGRAEHDLRRGERAEEDPAPAG